MMKHTEQTEAERAPNEGRRNFLLLIPLAIFAGMFGTIATAALRFLRPVAIERETNWLDVGTLAQLTGTRPIMRSVVAEHRAGWASTLEEHFVYVLPERNHQVLSSICPHEGCNVTWRDDTSQFACPCHDSFFGADGSRLSGPARRGLDPLPSREENGKLQIQYQFYVNNTEERQVRE
ncbi:MAG TPA: Rieske (2Fe-2S) protein [Pyrinomonadaceae bacterium]|jgi:Rieske Fe-S protein